MGINLERIASSWKSPEPEAIEPFLRHVEKVPDLNPEKLRVVFLYGEEARNDVKALTTGDATLLLRYRNKEGYTSSVSESNDDLEVLQLQGAKPEGYRVNTGMYVAEFVADQIFLIATDPDVTFRRITMLPPLQLCDNLSSVASHNAVLRIPDVAARYERMISRLKMGYSQEEGRYIVQLPRSLQAAG